MDKEGKIIDTWVTDRVDYLTADEEDRYIVAQANSRITAVTGRTLTSPEGVTSIASCVAIRSLMSFSSLALPH